MDSVVLDVERLGVSQPSGSQRAPLSDSMQPSISLEPLSPPYYVATPRTPADITVAVTGKINASPQQKVKKISVKQIKDENVEPHSEFKFPL